MEIKKEIKQQKNNRKRKNTRCMKSRIQFFENRRNDLNYASKQKIQFKKKQKEGKEKKKHEYKGSEGFKVCLFQV